MKTDVQLRHEVLEALGRAPAIDARQIVVTTREGVVTLTGSVPVYAQKFAAEEAVERVPGVEAIANAISCYRRTSALLPACGGPQRPQRG